MFIYLLIVVLKLLYMQYGLINPFQKQQQGDTKTCTGSQSFILTDHHADLDWNKMPDNIVMTILLNSPNTSIEAGHF